MAIEGLAPLGVFDIIFHTLRRSVSFVVIPTIILLPTSICLLTLYNLSLSLSLCYSRHCARPHCILPPTLQSTVFDPAASFHLCCYLTTIASIRVTCNNSSLLHPITIQAICSHPSLLCPTTIQVAYNHPNSLQPSNPARPCTHPINLLQPFFCSPFIPYFM